MKRREDPVTLLAIGGDREALRARPLHKSCVHHEKGNSFILNILDANLEASSSNDCRSHATDS
jgi:hypothetical protein